MDTLNRKLMSNPLTTKVQIPDLDPRLAPLQLRLGWAGLPFESIKVRFIKKITMDLRMDPNKLLQCVVFNSSADLLIAALS